MFVVIACVPQPASWSIVTVLGDRVTAVGDRAQDVKSSMIAVKYRYAIVDLVDRCFFEAVFNVCLIWLHNFMIMN